jgi:hypothetical protein
MSYAKIVNKDTGENVLTHKGDFQGYRCEICRTRRSIYGLQEVMDHLIDYHEKMQISSI